MRGVASVRVGERYRLDLPLGVPDHKSVRRNPIGKVSPPFQKVGFAIKEPGAHVDGACIIGSDDYVTFALQGSSHWDALAHVGLREDGSDEVFYNRRGIDTVDNYGHARVNGIDGPASVGVVGRGVLLDVARCEANGGDDPLPLSTRITPEMTARCIAEQDVEILPGDVVCLRTGWIERLVAATESERMRLYAESPGLEPSHVELAHRQRWAAVAADNLGVEFMPMGPPRQTAHVLMMRNLGLLFGELFTFRSLADACASDGRWEFLFMSCPLHVPGGLGSPPNAIAVR